MHPYFVSLIAQERHAQFLAEADRDRLAALARASRPSMWSRLVRALGRRRPARRRLDSPPPQVVIDLTGAGLVGGGPGGQMITPVPATSADTSSCAG